MCPRFEFSSYNNVQHVKVYVCVCVTCLEGFFVRWKSNFFFVGKEESKRKLMFKHSKQNLVLSGCPFLVRVTIGRLYITTSHQQNLLTGENSQTNSVLCTYSHLEEHNKYSTRMVHSAQQRRKASQ